ncbi:MAG TPA: glycoside hydrolase family 15 protein [Gaiellaceae bacterium]|nr:glycoside hydrolase family 15 protein [Gaiellaceae bacterium]
MTSAVDLAPLLDDPLVRRSVEVLKDGQGPSGAFVASPNFPTYHYAWLRDGAFCAHALDVAGESARAEMFHVWVVRSIETHRTMIEATIARIAAGDPPSPEEMPPARYTLDGSLEQSEGEPWPNFQFDGYGMWLWALAEHLDRNGGSVEPWRASVELVARYLRSTWTLKSFSCWEELDGGEHAATLAATVAGLDSAARLLAQPAWADEAARVRAELLGRFVHDGRFTRGPDDERVDGSLLWLGVPFGVVPLDDPRLERTVETIRRDLYRPGGGVYRYLGDTYYGGGEWILLACSLGWHEARAGNLAAVEPIRAWVREQAEANGDLPEQVADHALTPEMLEPWLERWGPIATPLLWSHAMYLIMEVEARI